MQRFKIFVKRHGIMLFSILSIIYGELILRAFTIKDFFSPTVFYAIAFAAVLGASFAFITSFFKEKAGRIIYPVLLISTLVIFAVQVVYHLFFGKYLILFSIFNGGADQVITDGIVSATLTAIFVGLPSIILLALPVIAYFVKLKSIFSFKKKTKNYSVLGLVGCAAAAAMTVGVIHLIPASRNVYSSAFDTNLSVKHFGLIATEVRDFKYNILGFSQSPELEDEGENQDETSETATEYNKMDIDFESLIASTDNEALVTLDKYFASQSATEKNEMTAKYKDYNIIFITAEGFSPYAIDKDITPTLYKMQNEGISFSNFYTPIWDVSTSDGEYVNCTGLIPKSGVWSMYMSGENYMPFCLGNQYEKLGIKTRYAFHNHNYKFYHRDVSHPNMGYNYIGLGNGLEKFVKKSWPESDLEMINGTAPMYLSSDRFCTYYMSVSGHLEYSKSGNAMAYKNWDKVKDLDCSDTVKAYYACHIEFDKAMEKLLAQLEKSGKADKTLIAISPDHYPYGLEDDTVDTKYHYFDELAGHKIETNFELYKSCFIIYSPSMKAGRTVSKYCSSLDVLPTLSNMLGLEYDSRLLMGKDIFSNDAALVIMSDRSWITDQGKYNANTEEFTLHPGSALSNHDEYVKNINTVVRNKFKISALMLENDYYAHALQN